MRVVSAGSKVLERQIAAGAPADVFVPAAPQHIEALGARLGEPATLTCNVPVIIVTPSSPIRSLRELDRAERLVVGSPEVPIGAYTEELLTRAGAQFGEEFVRDVRARIVSQELDVRQVTAKVVMGEADAAIVYRTDALSAGARVRAVAIDPDLRIEARYPISVVTASAERELAQRFVVWLRSDGMPIFEEHGFLPCDAP